MGYVETMYGHQSDVNAIDSWRKERVVTGGRDHTVGTDYEACFIYGIAKYWTAGGALFVAPSNLSSRQALKRVPFL